MCKFDENLIEIKKLEVLSELPNPFIFEDGTVIKKKEQWKDVVKNYTSLQWKCNMEHSHGLLNL